MYIPNGRIAVILLAPNAIDQDSSRGNTPHRPAAARHTLLLHPVRYASIWETTQLTAIPAYPRGLC